jgi:predicted nucleotidyltransferase
MSTQNINIVIPQQLIRSFCERHHVRKLALFGSVLRADFRLDSDIDVLVEFEPEARVGFFKFVSLADELGEILGRRVDLHTSRTLSRHIRQGVLDSARVIYEQTG